MKRVFGVLIGIAVLGGCSLFGQGPPPPPLTQKELVEILKSKEHRAQAPAIVEQRGVDFELNPEIEKQLRKAKADDALIAIVKKSGPSTRAERAAASGGPQVPLEEGRAIQAIQNELDPDRVLQLVNEFELKYPKSTMLTYAYTFGALAYQQKGDLRKVLEYGNKSMQLKSDNLLALLVMATMVPQPGNLRSGDPDKKLAQAEGYANKALQLIAQLPKQPGENDEQLQTRKAQLAREPHSALGMIHLERALQALEGVDATELGKAEEEYSTATTITPQPLASDFFRLGEVRERLKKWAPAVEAYQKASDMDQGVVKGLAEKQIDAIHKTHPAAAKP